MSTIERILFLIKEKGINQKVLAENTDISTGNITDWKKGKSSPSYGAIIKIAEYFKVNPKYLQCETDDPTLPGAEKAAQPAPLGFALSSHEQQVMTAYRANKTMQPAVDKLLGIGAAPQTVTVLRAAKSPKGRKPVEEIEMPVDIFRALEDAPDKEPF